MGQEEVYHFIRDGENVRYWMKEIVASQDTDASSTREYLKRLKDKHCIRLGRQGREVYFWIDASCAPFEDALIL
jgi:predicted transcriptional regulator